MLWAEPLRKTNLTSFLNGFVYYNLLKGDELSVMKRNALFTFGILTFLKISRTFRIFNTILVRYRFKWIWAEFMLRQMRNKLAKSQQF